jgi:hypothetical protein
VFTFVSEEEQLVPGLRSEKPLACPNEHGGGVHFHKFVAYTTPLHHVSASWSQYKRFEEDAPATLHSRTRYPQQPLQSIVFAWIMRRGLPGPQFWDAPRAASSGEMPSSVQQGDTVQLGT